MVVLLFLFLVAIGSSDECKVIRKINFIDCNRQGLTAVPEYDNYTWVKTLDLRNNNIKSINFTRLKINLPNLVILYLRGNPIGCVQTCQNLTIISYCHISHHTEKVMSKSSSTLQINTAPSLLHTSTSISKHISTIFRTPMSSTVHINTSSTSFYASSFTSEHNPTTFHIPDQQNKSKPKTLLISLITSGALTVILFLGFCLYRILIRRRRRRMQIPKMVSPLSSIVNSSDESINLQQIPMSPTLTTSSSEESLYINDSYV